MKICFWGNIANALQGKTEGGGELQLALLAKALTKGGHEVVVIDINTTDDFITPEGIKVFKIKGWNKGIRFIRIFTHRLPQLYRILKAQKANIYYCRILDFRHIVAFIAARKVNGKFILGMASDLEVMKFSARINYFHRFHRIGWWEFFSGILAEMIYPWLFKNADIVLTQHEGQSDMLAKNNNKSLVFPNLFDGNVPKDEQINIHKNFIYVGSLHKRKGFSEFYELVKKAPQHTFTVVGQPRDNKSFEHYKELKSFSNVSILGRLTHSETLKQIANSKAMVSTSPLEGFPNVFIEAWACGVPVLSLYVDPGDIIKRKGLGKIAHGSLDVLLQALDEIENTSKFSEKAKLYVENNHTVNAKKIKEISLLFSGLVDDSGQEFYKNT